MALLTLEGIYEDGRIELIEKPANVGRARVVVTFLPRDFMEEAEASQIRREAAERLLASMREGIDFGGQKFNRTEIYEARMWLLEEGRDR